MRSSPGCSLQPRAASGRERWVSCLSSPRVPSLPLHAQRKHFSMPLKCGKKQHHPQVPVTQNPTATKSKSPKSHKTPIPMAWATISYWYLWTAKKEEQEEYQATPITPHRSSTGGLWHLLRRHVVQQGSRLIPRLKTPAQAKLQDGAVITHCQASSTSPNGEETQTWPWGVRPSVPTERQRGQAGRQQQSSRKPSELGLTPMLGTPQPLA